MLKIRPSHARGHAQHGWLDSYHTFSFSDYYDPEFMGYKSLRVINEDRVEPAQGFPKHSHKDMEILSYVIEGALSHQDSLGTGSVIKPGDIQVMSAGSGVTHSEFNASNKEKVHFLQIWMLPNKTGLKPRYDQKYFSPEEKTNRFKLTGSPTGREGSLVIHQNIDLFASLLEPQKTLEYSFSLGRSGWLQMVRGSIRVQSPTQEVKLKEGDGLSMGEELKFSITAEAHSEFLFFDLGNSHDNF